MGLGQACVLHLGVIMIKEFMPSITYVKCAAQQIRMSHRFACSRS